MYGLITTIRRENHLVKHILWAAFNMIKADWLRVVDARDILGVSNSWMYSTLPLTYSLESKDSNRIQQYFSSEKEPTLWWALSALKELQTAWEKKRDALRYALYKEALSTGLKKLRKYYSRLDEKPSFVLALGKCFRLISST